MPQLAIRMNQAPGKGLGAFMPPPYGVTTPAASSQGVLRTEGHPGTMTVPITDVACVSSLSGGPGDGAERWLTSPSRVAPNFIRPDKYIPHISAVTTAIGFGRVSSNVAPVPIPYVARSAPQTQMKPRLGGRTTTAWPRQFVRWLTYREVTG